MLPVRDNTSKAAAAAIARREYPALFTDYQAGGLTNLSYEDLVAGEIRKGSSLDVAAPRVACAHPQAARQAIAKRGQADKPEVSVPVREWIARAPTRTKLEVNWKPIRSGWPTKWKTQMKSVAQKTDGAQGRKVSILIFQ